MRCRNRYNTMHNSWWRGVATRNLFRILRNGIGRKNVGLEGCVMNVEEYELYIREHTFVVVLHLFSGILLVLIIQRHCLFLFFGWLVLVLEETNSKAIYSRKFNIWGRWQLKAKIIKCAINIRKRCNYQ